MKQIISIITLSASMIFAANNSDKDSLKIEMEKSIINHDINKFNELIWPIGDIDFTQSASRAFDFYKDFDECKQKLQSDDLAIECINLASNTTEYFRNNESRIEVFSEPFKTKMKADMAQIKELTKKNYERAQQRSKEQQTKHKKWQEIGVHYSDIEKWEQLGLDLESAKKWISANQILWDVQKWVENGVTSTDSAEMWMKIGVTSQFIAKWAAIGFTRAQEWLEVANVETDISKYVEMNADPKILKGWLDNLYTWGMESFSADISYEDIKLFNQNKVPPSFAVAMKSQDLQTKDIIKQWKNLNKYCKEILPQENLQSANPYSTKGNCYEYSGHSIQLLSKKSGLFEGNELAFVSVSNGAIPKSVIGVVKSSGAYVYKSTIGAKKIVPNLNLIQYVPYTN